MARQHYIPASLIGGFSLDTTGPLRQRLVWVRRRGAPHARPDRAHNLGYGRHLYTLHEPTGMVVDEPDTDQAQQSLMMVDRAWTDYEARLPAAIPALINSDSSSLSADLWISSLVPFVAGLFVRGPEYNQRFESRPVIGGVRSYFGSSRFADNTNMARLIEMQRLMFPIGTAEWTVVHCKAPTVASNIGYCLMQHQSSQKIGYAIPLNPAAVLVLHTGTGVRWLELHWNGSKWTVHGIQHVTSEPANVAALNEAIAHTAIEIYGPVRDVVDVSVKNWKSGDLGPQEAPGPGFLVRDARQLREQEMFVFKVLTLIAKPPADNTTTILRMK